MISEADYIRAAVVRTVAAKDRKRGTLCESGVEDEAILPNKFWTPLHPSKRTWVDRDGRR